ncbi:MAG TPA: excinuclease ABC subunit UvrC [Polyangiaceae bacterium]|jgi:excinuclease ABC subunit C
MERENLPQILLEKLEALPVQSGCYLFKDKKGGVLYVGKAKSLRARVRSYFQEARSDERGFIPLLQRTVADLDTIVTSSEKEALILENNLIKEHKPRYNVKLRDDKDYLSLRLDEKDPWPRLGVVRRPSPDGARYFGPYHSATAARRTLHLVNKHFQLRTCGDVEMKSRKRPCLQYQIKRCPAPCVYEVDAGWYGEQVDAVAKFLDGRHDELSRELRERMQGAARSMRFELAAVYRDQLIAIDKVREEQRVVTVDDVDRDVLGIYREGELVELALLYVRAGKLADVATLSIKGTEVPDEEIVSAFIAQHYSAAAAEEEGEGPTFVPVPDELIVPVLPEGVLGIAEWLADRAGHKVTILVPQRGAKVDLLAMANENAHHAFNEKRREADDVQERLQQLQERLRLPTLPRRIECCDISHLGGGDTVGAVVAMKDGVPDKKHYRTFHVRSAKAAGGSAEAGDDYAAMYEVLARRFRRGRTAQQAQPPEGEPIVPLTAKEAEERAEQIDWELPDLFVVDGGKGQLNVALAAAHDLGLHGMPIVALAKEKENALGDTLVDRVYLPGQKNPINLRSHTASLFFLARARDEAHRFSNRARERLGKARRMRSALDDVPGIGAPTKKALLKALGSVAAVKKAGDDALLAVPGVTSRHVKALRKAFNSQSAEPALPSSPPTTAAPAAEGGTGGDDA